jgi:uncharacterized protein (TIGR00730 family)
MNEIQRIGVFCGAQTGVQPGYGQAAQAFAAELASRGLDLVYGGGSIGLMGVVARTVRDAGRHVIGVIPRALTTRELSGDVIGELVVVDTMAERKERILTLADAFVTLPGGFGTMDEMFEAITWGQLGIQGKAIGLLNINGYFDHLVQWVDHAVDEGFVRKHHRPLLVSSSDPAELLEMIAGHTPPVGITRWE